MKQRRRILIVDDEEAILTVLERSLKKLGPQYEVTAVQDGFAALTCMEEEKFDVIVTDYNMAQMDGLELIETIRYMQPEAQVIMITAYGNDFVESEVRRMEAFSYLTKPLEITAFREVIRKALGELPARQPKILAMSDQTYRKVGNLIETLRNEVGARCIFLANAEGRTIARAGDTTNLPLEEMASLLSGGIATLSEAGRVLDGEADTINLAYREGPKEYLYAINVGAQLLMILILDRGPYSSRLGSVWYYAQQTAVELRDLLDKAEYATADQIFNDSIDQAFDAELDKLFGDEL